MTKYPKVKMPIGDFKLDDTPPKDGATSLSEYLEPKPLSSFVFGCGANTGAGGVGFGPKNTCGKQKGNKAKEVLNDVIDDLAFYSSGLSGRQIESGFDRYARQNKLSAEELDALISDAQEFATTNDTYALDRYETSKAKFAGINEARKNREELNWKKATSKKQNITPKQSEALDDYAAAGTADIGHSARGDGKHYAIPLIDQAIKNNSFDEDVEVYHGMEWKYVDAKSMNDLIGKTIHDPTYISTTTNFETASRFANGDTKENGEYISGVIKLTIPKGTPAVQMGKRNKAFTESEILLGRNQALKITGFTDMRGPENGNLGMIINAELVEN